MLLFEFLLLDFLIYSALIILCDDVGNFFVTCNALGFKLFIDLLGDALKAWCLFGTLRVFIVTGSIF